MVLGVQTLLLNDMGRLVGDEAQIGGILSLAEENIAAEGVGAGPERFVGAMSAAVRVYPDRAHIDRETALQSFLHVGRDGLTGGGRRGPSGKCSARKGR